MGSCASLLGKAKVYPGRVLPGDWLHSFKNLLALYLQALI